MKKILVIEDNDDIREGTIEVLELAGYATCSAKNGKLGVELAAKHLPDLILCDIMMPELDGYGVLYLLQKNPQTAAIPFVFMTAKAERADMRKGMEMGADDYLTKPFDDLELFSAIESRLKKKSKPTAFTGRSGNRQALLDGLKAKGKLREFDAKQIIYVEGDEPSHLYFILKGQVKLYQRAKDGRELSSTLCADGEFFGYHSLCNGTNHLNNAATLMPTSLLLIPKNAFLDDLLKHQEIAAEFLELLSSHAQQKDDQLLKLAYFSVRKRVAETLVQLATKFALPDEEQCRLKISRDDLAALVGTASETVSRTLADFKAEKLIEKSGNAIHVLSITRLKNVKQ